MMHIVSLTLNVFCNNDDGLPYGHLGGERRDGLKTELTRCNAGTRGGGIVQRHCAPLCAGSSSNPGTDRSPPYRGAWYVGLLGLYVWCHFTGSDQTWSQSGRGPPGHCCQGCPREGAGLGEGVQGSGGGFWIKPGSGTALAEREGGQVNWRAVWPWQCSCRG